MPEFKRFFSFDVFPKKLWTYDGRLEDRDPQELEERELELLELLLLLPNLATCRPIIMGEKTIQFGFLSLRAKQDFDRS